MFGELVKSIETAFVDFSVRRALYVLFVLGLLVGSLYVFDRTTGYSSARRLDAQLSAIERLHALEKAGIRESATLAPIYNRIVAQVQTTASTVIPTSRFEGAEALLKFLAGAAVPLLFVLISLVQMIRGETGAGSAFGGAGVAAAVLGGAAVLSPTIFSLKMTLLGIFAVQLLLMFAMVRRYGGRSSAG